MSRKEVNPSSVPAQTERYNPQYEADRLHEIRWIIERIRAGDSRLNGEVAEAAEEGQSQKAFIDALLRIPENISMRTYDEAEAKVSPLRDNPDPQVMRDALDAALAELADLTMPLLAGEIADAGMVKLPEWVIRRAGAPGLLLAEGGEMLITGPGGAGKTTLALQLALTAVSGGGTCCGLEVRGGPALIVSWEDERDWIIEGMLKRLDPEAWRGVGVIGRERMPMLGPLIAPPREDRFGEPETTKAFDVVARSVERLGEGGLLILDSASDLLAGGNDAHSVRRLYAEIGNLARARDWATAVIAHPNKAGQRSDASDVDRVAGSVSWVNAARAVLSLADMKLTAIKCNRSVGGWNIPLARREPIGWAESAVSASEEGAAGEARAMADRGMSQREIAKELAVSRHQVRQWIGR